MSDPTQGAEDSPAHFRRVVQIAMSGVENTMSTQCSWMVYALCNDGTVWERCGDSDWRNIDVAAITTRRLP